MTGQPPFYLPPSAGQEARPFRQLNRELRRIGFECKYREDKVERTMEVLFIPQTDRTRLACKGASGDPSATGLKVFVHYGPDDDRREVLASCIRKGLEELRGAL